MASGNRREMRERERGIEREKKRERERERKCERGEEIEGGSAAPYGEQGLSATASPVWIPRLAPSPPHDPENLPGPAPDQ